MCPDQLHFTLVRYTNINLMHDNVNIIVADRCLRIIKRKLPIGCKNYYTLE